MSSMDRVTDDSDPSGNHQHHRRRQFPPGFDDAPPGFSPLSEAPPGAGGGGGGARKRQLSNTPTPDDGGPWTGFAKLYVGRFPVTATEEEIRVPFGEFGNVIEVFFIMSKWNGEPLGCCFVKYTTREEADRAIKALNGRYTFPGAAHPIKVRYADSDKERPGNFLGNNFQHKLYVSGLHRQAAEGEIAEIFTPFGVVEEVFIMRGDMRQHRGCAFIQFSRREMAIAAINALNGNHVMWGCDMPLIVRFADPKKPRVGGPRATPNITDQVSGFPNNSHPNAPHSPNKRCKPHSACVSNSLDSGFHSSSSSPYALLSNEEPADSADCDWSEHICPDGYPYYFNCVTCESRWEKPEELALYERQLLEHQHQHTPHLEPLSTAVAAQL